MACRNWRCLVLRSALFARIERRQALLIHEHRSLNPRSHAPTGGVATSPQRQEAVPRIGEIDECDRCRRAADGPGASRCGAIRAAFVERSGVSRTLSSDFGPSNDTDATTLRLAPGLHRDAGERGAAAGVIVSTPRRLLAPPPWASSGLAVSTTRGMRHRRVRVCPLGVCEWRDLRRPEGERPHECICASLAVARASALATSLSSTSAASPESLLDERTRQRSTVRAMASA